MLKSAAVLALLLLPQEEPSPSIAVLVDKLRSAKIEERDRAVDDLKKLGPDISRPLKELVRQERDLEVRSRLEHVLQSFIAERICDGSSPVVSPDGTRLACVRWKLDPLAFDMRGNPVYVKEVWVRDLQKKKDWRVAEKAQAAGWRDDQTLLLDSGAFVESESGKSVGEAARFPHKIQSKKIRWSPDGRQLLCIPDMMFYRMNGKLKPPIDTEGILYLFDGAGEVKPLPLGHTIDTDSPGFLSWSPDLKRLAFDLLFFRMGNVPVYRIGVLEFATGKVTFVGESAYCHYNWGLQGSAWTGNAQSFWDAAGGRFVFVTGRGNGEGEIHVSSADGSKVSQVTDDGQCKWCPLLDSVGGRVAFAAAKWGGENGTLLDGHLRFLDLQTGEEERFRPSSAGTCGTLTWTRDGKTLYYDWNEGGIGSVIYAARHPAGKAMPANAPIVAKTLLSKKQEVIKALASDNTAVVAWGAEAAASIKDPEVTAALKSALGISLKKEWITPGREILRALDALDGRAALPEVIQAIESKDSWTRCVAVRMLGDWKADACGERLAKIVRDEPDADPAVYAACALVRLGHEEAWTTLRAQAASTKHETRGTLASRLDSLRDGRAVDILIGLVADRARLYWDYTGEVQVGDHAEDSLARLSGQTFGRDPAKWTAWWKEREGKLPEPRGRNKALDVLRQEKEQRGEQRQKELRENRK